MLARAGMQAWAAPTVIHWNVTVTTTPPRLTNAGVGASALLTSAIDARLSCTLVQIVLAYDTSEARRAFTRERPDEVLAHAAVQARRSRALVDVCETVLASQANHTRLPPGDRAIVNFARVPREACCTLTLEVAESHAVIRGRQRIPAGTAVLARLEGALVDVYLTRPTTESGC